MTLPPLVAGERLDRATFHERYEAMPPQTRAELIGGVVHMPSPLSPDHGLTTPRSSSGSATISGSPRGSGAAINASSSWTIGARRSPTSCCSSARARRPDPTRKQGYLAGGPELVVEIARSSRRIDLGPKSGITSGPASSNISSSPSTRRDPLVRPPRRPVRTARARPGWALSFRGLPRPLARSAGAVRRRPGWAHHHARPRPRDPRTCGDSSHGSPRRLDATSDAWATGEGELPPTSRPVQRPSPNRSR